MPTSQETSATPPPTVPAASPPPPTVHGTDPAAAPTVPAAPPPPPIAHGTSPTAAPTVPVAPPPQPPAHGTSPAAPPTVPVALPPQPKAHGTSPTAAPTVRAAPPPCVISKLTKDVEKIKERLVTKDMEIDLLQTEVKTAYSVIDLLKQKIKELKKQINSNRPPQQQGVIETTINTLQRILLLGDENWTHAKVSDVQKNVSIRTIKEANIDLLKCWVSEKLNFISTLCIIYCGIYDIIENVCFETIFDNYSSLVSEPKEKNNNMTIHECQFAPVIRSQETQAKICDYNEHLRMWCESNSISIIKTDDAFRLGTGETDDMCYDMERDSPGSTLNRQGVIRLLKIISKHYPNANICKNTHTTMKTSQINLSSHSHTTSHYKRNKIHAYFPNHRTDNYNHRDNMYKDDQSNISKAYVRSDSKSYQAPNQWVEVVGRNPTCLPNKHSSPSSHERQATYKNQRNLQYNIPTRNRFIEMYQTYSTGP